MLSMFCCFKQKTAYELRISDWSSDVCSSDLLRQFLPPALANHCALANVRDDTLVFLVSSPVWKAKLRLLADAVLAAANSAGVPARELTLKEIGRAPCRERVCL